VRRILSFLRAEDVAWLLLFAVLGFCQPEVNYNADLVLVFIAAFQVIEPKVAFFQTGRGKVLTIFIKMLLCYLLVGWSHGINSSFYVIFLLPVISAATDLNLAGTILFILLACVAYTSFLSPSFVDWRSEYITGNDLRLIGLRISFFPVVGLLVYIQARGRREQIRKAEEAAERLAQSNKSLRAAEASLRRSERLAALGQLTAGLAHELRNPLGTIKASAELLGRSHTRESPELIQELAGYITTEVDRTNGLISRFLDFAAPLKLQAKLSDIRETVQLAAAQAAGRAEAKAVRIDTKLPQTRLEFCFDPELLQLALTNLLHNAIDASPAGASVRMGVERQPGEVLVSISDNGSGIPPDQLESIFNPFFTTKAEGTGLGLAIVSKIVDEHRGKLTVNSDLTKGTTFSLLLPDGEQSSK
jgi:two-component system, NtrC family, sensor histidine kinase HydH